MTLTTELAITGLYSSLLVIVYMLLSFNVIRLRLTRKVGIGSNGIKSIDQAIRAHGNFAEYVPLALIMLAALELSHFDQTWLHVFGASLLVSRVLHAIGLIKSAGATLPRQIGALITFAVMLVMAISFLFNFQL